MTPGDVLAVGYLVLLFVLYLPGPLLLGAGSLLVGVGATPVRRRDARVMLAIAGVLLVAHLVMTRGGPSLSPSLLGAGLALAGAAVSALRHRRAG